MKEKNILILGNGYCGKHIFKHFQEKNVNVCIAGRNDIDYHDMKVLDFHLDFFDVIICAFGLTGNPNVDSVGLPENKQKALFLNAILPKRIEELCKLKGVKYHHISTGCIYTYDKYDDLNNLDSSNNLFAFKEYTEYDIPNFGIYQDYSSYYSKTKHIGELVLDKNYSFLYRIRMPFNDENISKNILKKFTANFKYVHSSMNSLSHLDLLAESIYKSIYYDWKSGIYNVISGHSTAKQIIDIYNKVFPDNKCNSEFVTYKQVLDMKIHKENRSNCVLSNQKIINNGVVIPDLDDLIEKTFVKWKETTK